MKRLIFPALMGLLMTVACGGAPAQAPATGAAPAATGTASTQPGGTPAAAASQPTAPAALQKVTMQMSWTPNTGDLPFFLALDRGYYKAVGIDISFPDGKGSGLAAQLVGNGHGDFGDAALDIMALTRAKGAPLKAVMGNEQRNAYGVYVDATSPMKTVSDLVGHSVIVSPGSPETFYLPALAKKQHFDIGKVKLVSVSGANKYSDYINRQADAMSTDVTTSYALIEPKRPSRFIRFSDFGLVSVSNGIFAREDYIQQHPDIVRKVVAATAKGWEAMLQDPNAPAEAAHDMIKDRPDADLDFNVLVQEWGLYKGFLSTQRTQGHPFGWESAQDWQDTLQVLHDYAGLQGSLNPTDYFTNDFIPAQ